MNIPVFQYDQSFSSLFIFLKNLHILEELLWGEEVRTTHDYLPVLPVAGHLVGRPQLAEAATAHHEADDPGDVLGLCLLLVLVPLAVASTSRSCPADALALSREEGEVVVVQFVLDSVLDHVLELRCPSGHLVGLLTHPLLPLHLPDLLPVTLGN